MATSDIKAGNVTNQAASVDWQQGKSLKGCMEEMFTRGLWTDVKFYCKGNEAGETILAHKNVLSARSPVFQAMFFGPCADEKAEIVLKDVEKDAFLLFIKYIYSDTVQLNEENVFDVIALAHLYQVSSMVTFCADYLANMITPNNACEILTCAMLYQLSELKGACCVFIDSHAKQILVSEGFMNLSPDCLLYILKGDTFFAEEEHILKMADKWSRKRVLESGEEETGANIRKSLGDSFYQLRLPNLSHKSLLDNISRKGYFSVAEYADIAGYICDAPDVSVSTNSCVGRVDKEEILMVGNKMNKTICNNMFVSLEVSLKRDVALANVVFGDIEPYLKSPMTLFTSDFGEEHYENSETKVLKYMGQCIQINSGGRLYSVKTLKSVDNLQIPKQMRPELSCSIVIKDREFEKKFKVQQLKDGNYTLTVTPSLLLKQRKAPYLIEITLQYSLGFSICATYSNDKILSTKHGIQVKSKDKFLGIRSIQFENFSNR